ncbi:MAG: hypothetical protein R3E31_05045 [Chloroflexota bacterium]|nr:hypothetical protein [Anaerolineales bacterium]MCA9977602.1 hypothetical protein [Anaerolineales bacterium]
MFKFEHHKDQLLPPLLFAQRLLLHGAVSGGILVISLGIGVIGYHVLESLSWLDALLNAAMILGGMGPVNPVVTPGGKVFASFYALFSGMVFLVIFGIIVTPIAHRILHILHVETVQAADEEEE